MLQRRLNTSDLNRSYRISRDERPDRTREELRYIEYSHEARRDLLESSHEPKDFTQILCGSNLSKTNHLTSGSESLRFMRL